MKLNTLLLTSAATLMATSVAFAADLPSKKAAPAAGSVAVCKVGGMTGFTIPGSDTCLGIAGRVRFDAYYDLDSASDDGLLDYEGWGGSSRVTFDTRSNTEVGVVQGVWQLDGDGTAVTMRRAYVKVGGFTAGRKDSIADVYGTQSDLLGAWGQSNEGVDYQMAAGGLNFGIGLEAPNNNNETALNSADMPDIVGHLSGKVGDVGFAVAAVSHEAVRAAAADTEQGYAVMGNVNVTMGGIRLGVFGGTARNASNYTGYDNGEFDFEGGVDLDTDVYGASIMFTSGKVSLWAELARYSAELGAVSDEADALAIGASYGIAKNLTLTAEYQMSETSAAGNDVAANDDETFLVRINRDF